MRIFAFTFLVFNLCAFQTARATHNLGGYITYKASGALSFEFTVTTFTNDNSPADRPELVICYGDGVCDTIPRVNGIQGEGELIDTEIRKNVYVGYHTYPGTGIYTAMVTDANRSGGINNIPNSVNIPFTIAAVIYINPFIGQNSSPLFHSHPSFESGLTADIKLNFAADDPDGDYLFYEIVPCLGDSGSAADYTLPIGVEVNTHNGNFTWNSPSAIGTYAFAIKVSECRNGMIIGSTIYDFSMDLVNFNEYLTFTELTNWQSDDNGNYFFTTQSGQQLTFDVTLTSSTNNNMDISLHADSLISSNININTDSANTSYIRKSLSWTPTNARCAPYHLVFRGFSDTQPVNLIRDLSVFVYVEDNSPNCDTSCASLNIGVEEFAENEFLVYPNPAADYVMIEIPEGMNPRALSFSLYDIHGQLVLQYDEVSSGRISIDRSGLQSGIYFYHINLNGEFEKTGKLLFR